MENEAAMQNENAQSTEAQNADTQNADIQNADMQNAETHNTDSQNTETQDDSQQPETAGAGQDQETPRRVLSDVERVSLLEALLLANGDPLSIQRIQDVMGLSRGEVLESADRLQAGLVGDAHGIELVVVAEKLQLRTKAVYADYVRQLMAVKPRKLSQAALETLAVVAYQQPVVKSEIDNIRGVDVAPTLKTLLERKLVKIIGYQASVGQPALYGTTEDFLQVFGLSALSELPALHDLKALVKEPGEAQKASADEEQADEDQDESQPEVPYQEQPEGSQVSQ
jgi:segregation and condensation protein B